MDILVLFACGYWGDVGPDAGKDSLGRGPRGYDEVNQARGPGFFGWPYFVGNNYAYNKYDFETKKSSEPKLAAVDYSTIEKAMKMKVEPGQAPGVEEELNFIIGNKDGYVAYKNIGLAGIKTIDLSILQAAAYFGGGVLELHIDAPDGPLIGTAEVEQGLMDIGADVLSVPINKTDGTHDLYVVFNTKGNDKPVCALMTLEFKAATIQ